MRRRRRRNNVTWLPNLAEQTAQDEPINFIWSSMEVSPRGVLTTGLWPLVRDQDEREETDLADYTQGGYLLQRIVGKLRCALEYKANPEGPEVYPLICRVKAAFEVLRVGNDGTALQNDAAGYYNPDAELNERDPWIWQRSWILSNQGARFGGTGPTNYSAASGAFYWATQEGNSPFYSALDGPHIDVKVKRRIGPEERLFLVVSTWQPDDLGETGLPIDCFIDLDYRVLGTPLRSTNRRNASR